MAAAVLGACGGPAVARHPPATRTTVAAPAGPRWSAPVAVAGVAPPAAVSCPSPTSCVVLGGNGASAVGWGDHWSPATPSGLGPGAGGVSLSCTAVTFCAALGVGGGDAVTGDGRQWSAPDPVTPGGDLGAVGCAGSSFCVSVDALGNGWYFDGTGWQGGPGDWGSVAAVSCASPTFCASVSGGVSVFDGASWSQPRTYGPPAEMTGVSCPAPTFCVAVGDTGGVLTWNGTTWTGPVRLGGARRGGPGADLVGVSCASAAFCMAVAGTAGAFTWDGTAWTRGPRAVPGSPLVAVSCPAADSCVAVDGRGRVTTYGRGG